MHILICIQFILKDSTLSITIRLHPSKLYIRCMSWILEKTEDPGMLITIKIIPEEVTNS